MFENGIYRPDKESIEVLLPAVEKKVKATTNTVEQFAEKYIGKTVDGKYEVCKLIGQGGYFIIISPYRQETIHIMVFSFSVNTQKFDDLRITS